MAKKEKALLCDDEESNNTENEAQGFTKDSWRAFLVCFSLLLSRAFVNGVLHSWGFFLVAFVRDMNSSRERAAWIGSVAYGLSMTFGPVASALVNRFGHRVVMITGGILCSVAVFGSSFVTELGQMFGSFSVIYGIGACMSISPTMTIAPNYFDKYMTLAVGLMTAGSSVGTLIMAPLSQALIDAIGWRNTFRCFAGTCLFSAACCCLVRPLPSAATETPLETIKQSPAGKLMKELKLWKNRVFIIWTCAVTCVMFGYYIPYVHLVSYAQDIGIPPEKGSMLIMVLGISTAIGRIMFGKIVGLGVLNRLHMHQLSMVVTGTAVMMLPMIRSFTGIILYVVIIGLVDGCYVVLLPVLTVSLMAGENSVTAWGFLIGTSSVTFTLGPPVAGALYDALGSYNVAFHCAGIPVISGALILFFIPWAQRTSRSVNAMVVVSDLDCPDREKYDFADDLVERAKSGRERRSMSVGNDGFVDIAHIDLRFPDQEEPSKGNLRDQGTSMSPEDIKHVPQDLGQAISMLQENARLISEMLANCNSQPRAETAQHENWSAKSRSEMVQPTALDIQPQKMISIMSIPGGLAISHWEPRAPNQSDSVSNPPSMMSSQSYLQNAQSFHSRNISDFGSPGTQAYSPQQHHHQNVATVTSPSGRTTNPFLTSPSQTVPVKQDPVDITASEKINIELSRKSSSDRARGTESPSTSKYLSPPSPQGPIKSPKHSGTSGLSPRPTVISPVLCPIPEVTNKHAIDIHPPAPRADEVSAENDLDTWIDNSPNDPDLCLRQNSTSGQELVALPCGSAGTSSDMGVQSDSNSSVKESESAASAREIDVFTHLFDDQEDQAT
nr:uncharacterized protein LOC117691801 isoform X2 [Crassostrea gigas]